MESVMAFSESPDTPYIRRTPAPMRVSISTSATRAMGHLRETASPPTTSADVQGDALFRVFVSCGQPARKVTLLRHLAARRCVLVIRIGAGRRDCPRNHG